MASQTTRGRTHSGCTVHACMHALRLRCRFHLLRCTVFVPLSYPKHSGSTYLAARHPMRHGIPHRHVLAASESRASSGLRSASASISRTLAIAAWLSVGPPLASPRAHPHARAWSASLPFGASLAVFAWARGAARSAWGHVSSALGAVLTRPPETYVLLAGHAAAAEVCALWCARPRRRGGTGQLARGARALRRTHPFCMAVGVLSGYRMRGLRECG